MFCHRGRLLIQTQLNGIYRLTGTSLSKFSTEVDSEMMANSVYSCDQLSDGSYVIGTVSNGVFFTSKERLNIIFLKTKVE
jgi:hypothetical protein